MRSRNEARIVREILKCAIKNQRSQIIVVGRSYAKTKTEVIDPLLEALTEKNAKIDWIRKQIDVFNGTRIIFRTVHCFEEAERYFAGMVAEAVFCDENILDGPDCWEILALMKRRLKYRHEVGRFPLRFFIGAEEVRPNASGNDSDSAAKPEAAPVPEE